MLAKYIVLNSIGLERNIYIQTDSSKSGLGFIVYQTHADDAIYVIAFHSASSNPKQALCSPIEHESLAIHYAIYKKLGTIPKAVTK